MGWNRAEEIRLQQIRERREKADSGSWSVQWSPNRGLIVEAVGDGPDPDGHDAHFLTYVREDMDFLIELAEKHLR